MRTPRFIEPLETRIALATIVVLNALDSGSGSLRWAIEKANATPEADLIKFNLTQGLSFTIELLDALPAVQSQITIDATTQRGYQPGGDPIVWLAGPEGLLAAGLTLAGSDTHVLGLGFRDFAGAGIEITGNNNAIEQSRFDDNVRGIVVSGDYNVIGGGVWPNRIQGSLIAGIVIAGSAENPATGNVIRDTIVDSDGLAIDAVHAPGLVVDLSGLPGSDIELVGRSGAAIRLAGTSTSSVEIRDARIGFGSVGILVEQGAHDIRIQDNAFFSFHAGATDIRVLDGFGIAATENQFSGGIDLGSAGPNLNDPLDADTGANGLLNSPTLASLVPEFAEYRVTGSYDGAPNRTFRIVFHSVDGVAGETTVTTDENGHAEFNTLIDPRRAGMPIRALAADTETGDTSEFSEFVQVSNEGPVTIRITGVTSMERDGAVQAFFTVERSRLTGGPVSVDVSAVGLTAALGEDLAFTPVTINFEVHTTSVLIPVTILGDDLMEPIESYRLDLSDPVNATLAPGGSSALGFIRDDDHGFSIADDRRSVSWTDVDGDLVTLRSSKPIFAAAQFTFLSAGVGEQLAELDLREFAGDFNRQNFDLTFTVRKVRDNPAGDGLVNVGHIDATGVVLRKVTVPGDLGRIDAGFDSGMPSVGKLTVGSLGVLGLATQVPADLSHEAPGLVSELRAAIGSVIVKGDVAGATLRVAPSQFFVAPFGSVSIGGDLIGGAEAWSGALVTSGAIRSVIVKGDIIAGAGDWSGAIRADGGIGKITIGGSVLGAGTAAGAASLSAAGKIGGVKIGGDLQGGFGDRSGSLFTENGASIGAVTIGGTLSGHSSDGNGGEIFTGIGSAGSLGKVTVRAIAGAAVDDRVAVVAAGNSLMRIPGQTLALAGLAVKGDVAHADVLAGFDLDRTGVNPHAAIGAVRVGGDFAASRVLAGVTPEEGPVAAAAGVRHLTDATSRIASILIAGAVRGTAPDVSDTDLFGVFAQTIGSFKADGERLALQPNRPGAPLDDFLLGPDGDFAVRELA